MDDPRAPLRVAVVGARRVRNGIGSFVARAFARAGAEVCAVSGTSEASAREAASTLLERDGLRCAAYADADEMLAEEAPEVVAICSPTPTHAALLRAAAEVGAHCLCDKPLVWSGGGEDPAGAARALATAFAGSGRLLQVNAQWPWTLPAFRALHPETALEPLRSFAMWMSPAEPGPGMIPDSLPHVLSMLEALGGPGVVAEPRVVWLEDDRSAMRLDFAWRHAEGDAAVEVVLRVCPTQPRPAGYAINGARAERSVELPAYAMRFSDGDRSVPVEDPMDLRVADFVTSVSTGAPTDVDALARGVANLWTLAGATT